MGATGPLGESFALGPVVVQLLPIECADDVFVFVFVIHFDVVEVHCHRGDVAEEGGAAAVRGNGDHLGGGAAVEHQRVDAGLPFDDVVVVAGEIKLSAISKPLLELPWSVAVITELCEFPEQ